MYLDKQELLEFIADAKKKHEEKVETTLIPAEQDRNNGAYLALKFLYDAIEKDLFNSEDYNEFLLRKGYDPKRSLNGQKPSLLRIVYYGLAFKCRALLLRN